MVVICAAIHWPPVNISSGQRNLIETYHTKDNCRVFLLRQSWIINYYVKSLSNNLSNKNTMTCVSRKMIFQKKSLFWHLNSVLSWRQQKVSVRNTSVYVFIIENWHSKKTELWIFIKRKISVSGILHMKFWRKLTVCVDSLVCAVASLRLISLEAVGPLSLGSSHFKKARRVASSYIYWSLKKITIFIDL